jgi:signal transduction histidine kinase
VVGDNVKLLQVLLNIIGNAVKFTETGKVVVRCTSGRSTSDGMREFTFTVTDTGIGIPDDKKNLLFQSFSQVDSSPTRMVGGTGLGLAISKEIVELMGGMISFVSDEGIGTTFSFTIPLKMPN